MNKMKNKLKIMYNALVKLFEEIVEYITSVFMDRSRYMQKRNASRMERKSDIEMVELQSGFVNLTGLSVDELKTVLDFEKTKIPKKQIRLDVAIKTTMISRIFLITNRLEDEDKEIFNLLFKNSITMKNIIYVEIRCQDSLIHERDDSRALIKFSKYTKRSKMLGVLATIEKNSTQIIFNDNTNSSEINDAMIILLSKQGWQFVVPNQAVRDQFFKIDQNMKNKYCAPIKFNESSVTEQAINGTLEKHIIKILSNEKITTPRGVTYLSNLWNVNVASDIMMKNKLEEIDKPQQTGQLTSYPILFTFNITTIGGVALPIIMSKLLLVFVGVLIVHYLLKASEIDKMGEPKLFQILTVFSNSIMSKMGYYKEHDVDNLPESERSEVLLTVSMEKEGLFRNISKAMQYSTAIAIKEMGQIKQSLLIVMGLAWLNIGLTVSVPLVIMLILIALTINNLDPIIIANLALLPIPIPMKVAIAVAYGVYVMKLIKLPKFMKYLIMASVTGATLTNSVDLNQQWVKLDKLEQVMNRKSVMQKYWLDLGAMSGEQTATRWIYVEPKKKRLDGKEDQRLKLDITRWVMINPIHEIYVKGYRHSVHNDAMFIKAIAKRVIGAKNKIDLKQNERFYKLLIKIYSMVKPVILDTKKAVEKVLKTKGTAGSFAKHTTLEDKWKNVNEQHMVDIWAKGLSFYRTLIIMNQDDIEEFRYQIYEKVETLPIADDGQDKTIRLIQAPNLFMRVTDAKIFHYLNEAIPLSRFNDICQIGLNIYRELKYIVFVDIDEFALSMDMGSFDGTQHPYQMKACRDARIAQIINYNLPLEDAIYVAKRYDKQIFRIVEYKGHVKGFILGTQATGDTTTSDDNTMRNATYLRMLGENLQIKQKINIKRSFAQGDDSVLIGKVEEDVFNQDDIIKETINTAADIGWIAREVKIDRDVKWTGFLAHSVDDVIFETKKRAKIIIPIITREPTRVIAKFWLSGDKIGKLNQRGKEIMTSKCLSFIYTSIAIPHLWLTATVVALIMQGNINKEMVLESYGWTSKIDNVNLNCKITSIMDLHLSLAIDVEYILITTNEQRDMLNKTIIWATQLLPKKISDKISAAYQDNKLNLKKILKVLRQSIPNKFKDKTKIIMEEINLSSQCGICGGKITGIIRIQEKTFQPDKIGAICQKTQCESHFIKQNRNTRKSYIRF